MSIHIASSFAFTLETSTTALLQFEAAEGTDQHLIATQTLISATDHRRSVPAQDGVGKRIWVRGKGRVEVQYEAQIDISRSLPALSSLPAPPLHELPGEAVPYLFDSRYCRADDFQGLVEAEFAGTEGGARIEAIRQWIAEHFDYVPGSSDTSTTATESFIKRQGICRDYSHVLVTLARASLIPARYVACYAPGVTPQDFHAVAEVYLSDPSGAGGRWHLVDATGMADLSQAAKIGVGRDAADVSFITTFGPMSFEYSRVAVAIRN